MILWKNSQLQNLLIPSQSQMFSDQVFEKIKNYKEKVMICYKVFYRQHNCIVIIHDL
jgi:hypothetical protein